MTHDVETRDVISVAGNDPCATEPIHIPGSIQPHGVLLTVDPANLTVLQVAGDVRGMLNLGSKEVVGQSLKVQIGSAALDRLNVLLTRSEVTPRPCLVFQMTSGSNQLSVNAHLSGGLLVLEIERYIPTGAANSIEVSQEMASVIGQAVSASQLLECMATEIQRVTGFDRVMVYRFDEEANGQVVVERRSSQATESYLGLHYPASDIPPQARYMYISNWIRCIPDVSYVPVPIVPSNNPLTGSPIDLRHSSLRSVSPIHIEYLKNMGVTASMSLSIVVRGKLWGLIACHHYEARYLNCDLRSALELFAQLSSLQLTTLLEVERSRLDAFRRDIQDELLGEMTAHGFPHGLEKNCALLTQLVSATGVVVHADGKSSKWGQVPGESSIASIVDWLNGQPKFGVWSTNQLAEYVPCVAMEPRQAAGLLALSISRLPSYYILWFLPEQTATITWAGDPHKPGEHHLRMSPRKSFAAWHEQVTGRSRVWAQDEIDAALRLRIILLELALAYTDEVAKERDAMAKKQQILMAELDHRVKNVLATIQALVRFSGKNASSIVNFTRSLERRLVSMARAHDLLMASRWEGASLHRLVSEELAAFRPANDSNLQIVGDDVMLSPSCAISLSLLLHELVTNALKYGSLSVQEGKLEVISRREESGTHSMLILQWVERGGPPVATPTCSGFGRLLMEKVFQRDSGGGRVDLKFDPEGVQCTIRLPLRDSMDVKAQRSEMPVAVVDGGDREVGENELDGVCVLVVEDNYLVSLHVEEIICEAGGKVLGPYRTIEESMSIANSATYDVALLDVDLNGKEVWPLARLIRDLGIPIVFATGFSDIALRPTEFCTAMSIRKPYDAGRLTARLRQSCRSDERPTLC